ncbi:Spy/CpxP family protein refolding chaperone [Actinokineospora baliensis]|uniref:hypothetical protein n=1 Tax=Actinokineospora baliensis TaxID=547056 RepID=UPI00195836B4|nr:hypothetical protein [Actinokineospora baliensis]MBM7771809.1 Spy/CpxP family protein refolding chaperone [Actinokineospora baliensis]
MRFKRTAAIVASAGIPVAAAVSAAATPVPACQAEANGQQYEVLGSGYGYPGEAAAAVEPWSRSRVVGDPAAYG